MTAPKQSSSGTAEAVAYCGWHPEHGYALQTCGHDQQHAASLLMRTDLAGNHGWSVQPLYAALSPTPQTAGGVREAIAEWLLRDRGLKDASIEEIKEYRGETYLKALDDADEILALSPQAQAGETYSGQTATNLGATIEVVGAVSGVAQGLPDCGIDHTEFRTNIINHCANICKTMREKHGSPTGDAYTNGVWDQGVRDEQAIRGLIEALSLPSTEGKRRD